MSCGSNLTFTSHTGGPNVSQADVLCEDIGPGEKEGKPEKIIG